VEKQPEYDFAEFQAECAKGTVFIELFVTKSARADFKLDTNTQILALFSNTKFRNIIHIKTEPIKELKPYIGLPHDVYEFDFGAKHGYLAILKFKDRWVIKSLKKHHVQTNDNKKYKQTIHAIGMKIPGKQKTDEE